MQFPKSCTYLIWSSGIQYRDHSQWKSEDESSGYQKVIFNFRRFYSDIVISLWVNVYLYKTFFSSWSYFPLFSVFQKYLYVPIPLKNLRHCFLNITLIIFYYIFVSMSYFFVISVCLSLPIEVVVVIKRH